MKEKGFYIISDDFFKDMSDPYLRGNKNENRPHYYCFEDTRMGIYWMIPMSTRVEKYRNKMICRINKGMPCDILHIAKLDNGKENVFLIQDMFPVTKEYVEREYTIQENHLTLTAENTVKDVEKKARKVLRLIKNGVKFNPKTQPDVLRILDILKQKTQK